MHLRSAVLLLLALACPARADVWARHNISAAEYQTWANDVSKKNYRITEVSVHSVAGKPVFCGIAVPNTQNLSWNARHHLTSAEYQSAFNDANKEGRRVISAAVYVDGKDLRYAGIWVNDKQSVSWSATHDQTSPGYQQRFNEAVAQGMRPLFVNAHDNLGGTRFVAAFVGGDDDWFAAHDLTEADFQKRVSQNSNTNFFPVWASGYRDFKTTRFSLVMVRDGTRDWEMRHGLTAAEYQKKFEEMANKGYRLLHVSGYDNGGQSRFLGIWVKDRPLPTSGDLPAGLVPFDEAMRNFMLRNHIRSGVLAVMRDGRVVLTRGYGWLRRDGSRLVQPTTPFRLASTVKPVTAAAIRRLIAQGKLKLDDKAFGLLGLTPPANGDARLKEITIGQLLDHRGGWDRTVGPLHDPMFQQERIAKAQGKKVPVSANDITRYMLTQPLQLPPGKDYKYSNFGYCVLGRLIEKVTGESYTEHTRKSIMAPVGAKHFQLGRSLPKDRSPLEPFYYSPTSAFNLSTGKGQVPEADGGFYLEAMDSHGGVIASASDMVRFLNAYTMSGNPRNGGKVDGSFFGSLPGTHTLIRHRNDGVYYTALFNTRYSPEGRDLNEIQKMLDDAVGKVKKWP